MPTKKPAPKKTKKKSTAKKPNAKPAIKGKKVAFGFGANEKKTKRSGNA